MPTRTNHCNAMVNGLWWTHQDGNSPPTRAVDPFFTFPGATVAVMTHASARTEADYNTLSPVAQAVIDQAMEKADNAAITPEYTDAMEDVAIAAGIPLPASRDLAVCSCLNDAGGCGCGTIFDSHALGVVVTALHAPNRNLSELQCPTCGHDHPRPITD